MTKNPNNLPRVVYLTLIVLLCSTSYSQVIAYLPNKHWHVAGQLPKNTGKYPFRYFGPQFSYPHQLIEKKWDISRWQEWEKQNNFTYAYPLVGHSWQIVIQRNKEVFQQHPEYLAQVNGQRPGYGKTSKFCVSNKKLQQLFIQDRLQAFEELKNPAGAVSVEPSDGGGFCECANCKKMGTVSNQVFYIANLTAKAVRKKYPQGKVNLYAYYQHAQVPDFDLEPNVHVTVIPQGFQTLYDPEVMLILWGKKAKLKTYYEYFAIPQWKGEQPRLHMQDFIRRMQLAKSLGYEGYWFETGLNINAAIALQLFNQLWLNPELTWEQVSEQFLRACFAGSYQPMKQLFTRWWYTWLPEEEIPMALKNLQDAGRLATSSLEQERINDLKAYVHYLALYQEWNKDRKDQNSTAALFEYLYHAGNRAVVNTNALYQIFIKHLSEEQKKKYGILFTSNWSWIKPITASGIEKNFREDLKKYGTAPNNFVHVDMHKALKEVLRKEKPLHSFQFNSQFSDKLTFHGKGELNIELITPLDAADNNNEGLYLSIHSVEGNFVKHQFVPYNASKIQFTLPKSSLYTISLSDYFSTSVRMNGTIVPIISLDQSNFAKPSAALKLNGKAFTGQLGTASLKSSYYFLTP